MKKTILFIALMLMTMAVYSQGPPAVDLLAKSITYKEYATPPANPILNKFYLDTDGFMYKWNGSAWVIAFGSGGGSGVANPATEDFNLNQFSIVGAEQVAGNYGTFDFLTIGAQDVATEAYVDAAVGGTDNQTAAEVTYDNTSSALTADTAQEAIDELAASGSVATKTYVAETTATLELNSANVSRGNDWTKIKAKNLGPINVEIDPTGIVETDYWHIYADSTMSIRLTDPDIKGKYWELPAGNEGKSITVEYNAGNYEYNIPSLVEYNVDFFLSIDPDFYTNSTAIVSSGTANGDEITEGSNLSNATPDAVAGVTPQYFNGTTGPQLRFVSANNDYLTLGQTIQYTPLTEEGYVVVRLGDTFASSNNTLLSQAVGTSGSRAFQIYATSGFYWINMGGTAINTGVAIGANQLLILNIGTATYDFWVDGVKEVDASAIGAGTGANDILIGARTAGANVWNGDIDVVGLRFGSGTKLTQPQIDGIEEQFKIN